MNFANQFQEAMGLRVTAEQFLEAEFCSNMTFVAAALESDSPDTAGKFLRRSVKIAPRRFEKIVANFLLAIWRDGADADEEMETLGEKNPKVLGAIGKAADAIERRNNCIWGSNSTPEGIEGIIKECTI